MKKGITLACTTLLLAVLLSQEATPNNSIKYSEPLSTVKEVEIGAIHGIVDSLKLYVCKVDSANSKNKSNVGVLKRDYKELKRLDSILTALTIHRR